MNNREVGMNIKKARKNKGLKQKELANLIGFSESSISKYEQGLISIPIGVLEQIAKALDVSTFDLTIDVEQLRSDVKLQEEIEKAFGKNGLQLLNDFDTLNNDGKVKANEYLADLATHPTYKKEPSSVATDNGS